VSSSTQSKDKNKDKDTTIMAANQNEQQGFELFEDEMRADEVFRGFMEHSEAVMADNGRARDTFHDIIQEVMDANQ
jgi:hypothetical protein